MTPSATRRIRAEFSIRGEVYVLVQAWALTQLELRGYERVEPALAGRILASLPPTTLAQPKVRAVLARRSPRSPARPEASASMHSLGHGPRGLILLRRARIAAQSTAPPPQEIAPEPAWEPAPPPMIEPVVELTAQAAIAATLLAAAAVGAPFCEKCECQT